MDVAAQGVERLKPKTINIYSGTLSTGRHPARAGLMSTTFLLTRARHFLPTKACWPTSVPLFTKANWSADCFDKVVCHP